MLEANPFASIDFSSSILLHRATSYNVGIVRYSFFPEPSLPNSSYEPQLHIVLHQPEIPPNTGAVGRTCVALQAKLWLIRPLGFQINEKTLRRAGLDYWQHLEWEIADHWEDFVEKRGPTNLWMFSRFATNSYLDVQFAAGDTLVFGCETAGLPKTITDPHADRLLRIPTYEKVRSINLSCAVAVAGFEATRQLGL
jgi:tRNA (cytidine/uridine-2'-O-)-methyltransferase